MTIIHEILDLQQQFEKDEGVTPTVVCIPAARRDELIACMPLFYLTPATRDQFSGMQVYWIGDQIVCSRDFQPPQEAPVAEETDLA